MTYTTRPKVTDFELAVSTVVALIFLGVLTYVFSDDKE